jgi:hypothetical protein
MELVEVQDPHGWSAININSGKLCVMAEQVAGVVRLSSAEGHIYLAEDGDWIISAEGYRVINRVAGIREIEAKTMFLPDGREVRNPYIEFDEETNSPLRFWAYSATVSRGIDGKPFVSTAMVIHDIRLQYIMELTHTINVNKDAGKYCTYDQLSDEEKKNGYFEPFQGKLGIYAKTDHADVIPVMSNLIRRKNYGEREAKTLAWRSSIRMHPYMPPAKVKAQNGIASVLVSSYLTDLSEEQLRDLYRELSENGSIEGVNVHAAVIDSKDENPSEVKFLSSEGGPRF